MPSGSGDTAAAPPADGTPGTTAASAAFASATTTVLSPAAAAAMTAGTVPGTGRSRPSRMIPGGPLLMSAPAVTTWPVIPVSAVVDDQQDAQVRDQIIAGTNSSESPVHAFLRLLPYELVMQPARSVWR